MKVGVNADSSASSLSFSFSLSLSLSRRERGGVGGAAIFGSAAIFGCWSLEGRSAERFGGNVSGSVFVESPE